MDLGYAFNEKCSRSKNHSAFDRNSSAEFVCGSDQL